MIKKIIVSLCLLVSLSALAQEGTSSPYSFYGIGDIKFKGTVENRSMGGLSVFPDSIHINLQNPAQFASLKRTNLSVGASYLNTKAKTESDYDKSRRTALDYLAFGIPVGKLGIGFGLIPYSSVGYKIQKVTVIPHSNNDTTRINNVYRGIGGVNRVFLGFGYKVTKKINVGADIQYNFGTVETTGLRSESLNYDVIQLSTKELNTSELHGFNIDLGISYQTKLNKKLSYFGSIAYTPESKLFSNNTRNIETVQQFTSGSTVYDNQSIDVADTTIKLPSKLALGSGFGDVKRWLLGAEVTLINYSVMSNRFSDIDGGSSFKNGVRYSLGGYYTPNLTSYSNYFKRITYRAGIRYENTGLVIQNKSINDFAGNIGVGLPLRGSISNMNIGLEVGRRGTKYYNLVEENYVNLSIGLSLSDEWFVKRKYD
ncbi:outer membrane protein transport protein [Flavobacterium sp. XGLA_31]|uniref:outer membrane protein transport protein n=1 Tax=Flavobacterium sp. XGLA_31 TaxID=3447666 RepID=UPI003F36FF62